MVTRRPRLALFVDRLTQGGVQHSFVGLANAFVDHGFGVDLVVGDRCNWHDHDLAEPIETFVLHSGARTRHIAIEFHERLIAKAAMDRKSIRALPIRWRSFIPGLARYLMTRRPDTMLSAKTLGNLTALLAHRRAHVATRLVVSERSHLSESIQRSRKRWKEARLPSLIHALYPKADAIVAISQHVADDLAATSGLEPESITKIHNGLLRAGALDHPPDDHPWFDDDRPVILAAGRFRRQKDFPMLIRAFAKLRARRPARLMIIGEGEDRAIMEKLIRELSLRDDVALPGFKPNPFAFMKAADLFVMSSTHEGFGNVLVEALAAGCPVVSTDCPAGPFEILDGGRYGKLVPVGDEDAMANAIEATLDHPPAPDLLRSRASEFSLDRTVDSYLACLLPDRLDHSTAA
ncbi:MAG: glycosyltransferase [Pseudomonadota bacterium]